MRTHLAALFAAVLSSPATAEPVEFVPNERLPAPYRQVHATRDDGSTARIYLHLPELEPEAPRPLMVYVEGSGAQSVVRLVDNRGLNVGLFGLIGRRSYPDFLAATIDKRGVEFGDPGRQGGGAIGASEEYQRHATLADRVADVRLLLDTLLEDPRVDPDCVVLVGHSEGSDVVAATAGADERVTHVAFLAGGGPEQFFEFFLQTRQRHARNGTSPQQAEEEIQELQDQMAAILENPDSTTDTWMGHAYRRWATFAATSPADGLMKSEAMLFLGHGSADTAVPIESFDHLVVRLMCAGKTDLTVRRYPGRDHSFNPPKDDPDAGDIEVVIDDVVDWAITH